MFNFIWSAAYNLFAVLFAAGVFDRVGKGGIRIPPGYAGLGEVVSVLPIVGVALGLRFWRSSLGELR